MQYVLLGWTDSSWERQTDDMKVLLCVVKLGSRVFLFLKMQTQFFQGRNLQNLQHMKLIKGKQNKDLRGKGC